ncbi:MAG: YcxB family protein [Oscillospiraceae bacterium]|nr:YcxB family protein [Oscillospiraceae bacterium]
MEFVNRTVIGSKELTALSRGTRKAVRRRKSLIVQILAVLIIALNLLFAWASWRVGDSRWWLNGAVAVFLLVITWREDWFSLQLTGRYVQPDAQEVTTSFGPDGFTQTSKAADGRFQYSQIEKICETSDYFLFYLDHNLGQIYDKNGFTKGTAMSFREFIIRKTGLMVQNVR